MKFSRLSKLLCIALLSACSPAPTVPSGGPIKITLRKSDWPKKVPFSEVSASIRLVPLETTPESLLKKVAQADEADGKIFVFDQDKNRGVFVFSAEGKFLYRFGNPGKGPGEYTSLAAFSFSPDRKTIYLCASDQSKLIAYTPEGKWIRDIEFGSDYGDMQFIDDSRFVLARSGKYLFRIGSLENNTFRDSIEWLKGMVPGNARLLFRGSEGRYLFSAIFSEEVYAISRDGISPRYVFDFGPHAITLEEQMASFKNDNNYPSKMLMQEGPFIETRDYFYFLILKHKTPERVADAVMVRNHRTGEMVQIEPDDILYSNAQLALGLTLEDEFVASLDPADLVTRADTILTNRFRYPKEILQKIPLLKPDDNPVLVFFTIK